MAALEMKACFAILCLLIVMNGVYTVSEHGRVTGYDIELTCSTIEETREALRAMENEGGQMVITGVFNTTVSLYTTSYDEVRKVMKKRDSVKVTEVSSDYTGYYTYETMTAKLREWEEAHGDVMRLFSLGSSVGGRALWAVELSLTRGNQSEMLPNVKYVGNMHGDEVVGRELLMNFIQMILEERNSSAQVASLLDKMHVYIVPTMNPDGFANGIRFNQNGIDLNRNFPDQYRASEGAEQVETKLMKEFLASKQWMLSANLHGGDLVANYPWDGRPDNLDAVENASPDDDVFQAISKVYARTNSGMLANPQFLDGITNGAAWYVLYGGMQDFNYIHHGCFEITLEVSIDKWPPASELPAFWQDNKDSLLNYLLLAHSGVRGQAFDANTSTPLANVLVTVPGREISNLRTRSPNGAFFRLLPNGDWFLDFSLPGYLPTRLNVSITSQDQPFTFDVFLERDPSYVPEDGPYMDVPHTSSGASVIPMLGLIGPFAVFPAIAAWIAPFFEDRYQV